MGGVATARLASWNEPAPHGMVHIPRGHVLLGEAKADSLWGTPAVSRGISVEAFWMDRTEVTNAQYRQFVYYVRDSILRERLADPAYGGDESYKITEDKDGEPTTPHLDWSRPIPSEKRATEEELRALQSIYYTNPVTGEKKLDPITATSAMTIVRRPYGATSYAKHRAIHNGRRSDPRPSSYPRTRLT